MQTRKKWQKFLVIGVLLLTVYNILPTVFFYSKPLSTEINSSKGAQIATSIADRVNHLESESKAWLYSFCKLLKVKPQSIYFDPKSPQQFTLTFKDNSDAKKFRSFLPRAGNLIPFVPMQLSVGATQDSEVASKTVSIQRKIPIHFSEASLEETFQFSEKFENGAPTPLYKALVFDRALQLGLSLGGANENGILAKSLSAAPLDEEAQTTLLRLCHDILSISEVFGDNSSIAERYFATFSQVDSENSTQLVQGFLRTIEQAKDQAKLERINLQSAQQSLAAQGEYLDSEKQQRLEQLQSREKTFATAEVLVKKRAAAFAAGARPWTFTELNQQLEVAAHTAEESESKRQILDLKGQNPFIQSLIIDWSTETIELALYEDILEKEALFEKLGRRAQKEHANQFIYNEIAFAARQSGEKISPVGSGFQVTLNQLQGSTSFLALKLKEVASARADEIETLIKENWLAKSPDLIRENFPIWNYETYQSLPAEEQGLGLVVYAPAMHEQVPQDGLKMNSVYVIAKGLDKIFQRVNPASDSPERQQFFKDFETLRTLLQQSGLFGYPGATLKGSTEFVHDFIFEGEDYFQNLIKATREDFAVHGTKRFGVLEFTNVEQRILTENRIDDQTHEDLLKWRDDYHAAQLGLGGASSYDVPKPTESPLLSNLHLSFVKYFRGDERKILHWGLDLSGGKTVQIELFDTNGRLVTNDDDIKQGINELYGRVNKMGVSEVSIRREGNFITLDFPGSQSLSASDLIKASTMYFHIVNEKFNRNNADLAAVTDQFLQEIWNEAAVTGRKSAEEINQIAWKHLHGDSLDPEIVQPRSQAAKTLYENGLRLRNPQDMGTSNLFNDAVSQIAVLRGDDFTQWHGQTNPLVIVFRNYALEGASLKNIQGGYDPSKGNYLLFEIKGKETLASGEKINPREDLFAWTSQFSKDKIAGTPYATVSKGEGWRMAVILNGTIITSPTLSFPIRDGGTIEGSFTQREITKLESDLKAGSLTFTPRILSEKNVSPEIGSKDRTLGIIAMSVALCLVILTMISYYRFAGFVASIAVVFNLLIMWATLQNIGATLTFASIAGVILALGMAVDANVLVFERIREEFAVSGRIASAVRTGYRKAFWAIFDSNVTTIIAAIVLLQFDSGPIRGFAITLIIGIVSSMFTALFMTRFFFAGWIQNPKHVSLKMATLIKSAKYNFMKSSKYAFLFSAVVILAGAFFFAKQHSSILGMDFTGGYSLNIELVASGGDLRQEVESALVKGGATKQEFQVRQLTSGNQMRVFLGKSMQLPGHPFSGMPLENDIDSYSYPYELNPRISWVVTSLENSGLKLSADSLQTLQEQWSEISGQLSDSMKRSALIGLGIALLAILAYITFRFEFKYAISATLCLAHDIAATVGSIALLYALDVPIQIDLNTVAALMTIVGYSLNDTIIIFDRIREDLRLMHKASFKEIINHALNMTLSRTVMTSGTTLVALVPLALLGGGAVFGFALVMIIGVIFGTLSSLYIAAPLLNYFHERQKAKALPQVAV